MNNFFSPSNLLGRVVLAIFYGVCVFVTLLIIAAILKLVGVVTVADIIDKYAYILALLAALVSFFTGAHPTV